MRQERQGFLSDAKAMGEIAMQPVQQRALEGQVETQDMALQQAQRMQQLGIDYAAAQKVAEQGGILTTDKAPSAQLSAADSLLKMAQFGADSGMDPVQLAPLWEKAATIKQHEAAAASSDAQAKVQELKAQAERNAQRGAFAQAALEGGAANYAMIRGQAIANMPAGEKSDLSRLPEDYAQAVPLLKAALSQSMSVKDKLELEASASLDEARERRQAAGAAKDFAAVGVAKAREALLKAQTDNEKKYGGPDAPGTKKATGQLTVAQEATLAAKDRKEFPGFPVEPALRFVGKTYNYNGQRVLVVAKAKDGTVTLRKIEGAAPPKRQVTPAPDEDE
jgi:hypothetical protein